MSDAPRRSRRVLVRLAVAFGMLAFALAALDVWVGSHYLEGNKYSWVQLPPYSRIPEQQREKIRDRADHLERIKSKKIFGAYDQDLGWDYLPGTEGRGHDLRAINSIGARGSHEFPEEPPPDRVRIACFGESFTYGTDVLDGDDWPSKVGRFDERLEMINMGVGGYGTDQVLLRMRRDCAKLRPRGVVIGYMLENCLRNVNRWRTRLYVETEMPVIKPRFVLNEADELELVPLPYATRSEAYRAAADGVLADVLAPHEFWDDDVPLVPFSNISKLLTARHAMKRRKWPQYYADMDSEPMRVTVALLEECCREARACGAEHVLVLVFPSRKDLRDVREGAEPYWLDFLAELERRDVPFEDLANWLRRRPGTHYGEEHFNAKGNDMVAEGVWLWTAEMFTQ